MTAKRGGLGKGLDSLIKENKTAKHTAPVKKEVVNAGPIMMKINDVEPNRDQPRKPPQASNTSPMRMPLGTMTFFGLATAEPSTVMHFSTSGMPVLQYRAMLASVVQLRTIAPTSSGSLPSGTTSPMVL